MQGWSNILHATIGGNIKVYGDRIPSLWFYPGTTKLLISSAVSGKKNFCKSTDPLPMNNFSTIVIQQVQKAQYGNLYFYQIIINDKMIVDVLNNLPKVFYNVTYYLSDPWHLAARAFVRRLGVVNLEHKGMYTPQIILLIHIILFIL